MYGVPGMQLLNQKLYAILILRYYWISFKKGYITCNIIIFHSFFLTIMYLNVIPFGKLVMGHPITLIFLAT